MTWGEGDVLPRRLGGGGRDFRQAGALSAPRGLAPMPPSQPRAAPSGMHQSSPALPGRLSPPAWGFI